MSEAAYQDDPIMDVAEPVSQALSIPRISIHGFFEDPTSAHVLESAATDRRLAKTHTSAQLGGIPAAVEQFASAPTPNLIIVESRAGREGMLAELSRLAEVCDAGTKVVVIGHLNDVVLYREMVRQGVSEYIVAPFSQMQIINSIASLYNDPDVSPVGRVFAFVGAKGGVGSSTIAHNIGWVISDSLNEDAVIADLDIPFGTAGLNFNQDPTQGIAEALTSPDRLDEVFLERLLSKCSDRLSLFAAPAVIDRDFEWEDSALEAVIDVVRRQVPCFVMDIPHVWTPWARQAMLAADDVVITAEPDLANLRNAKNLVDVLKAARKNDNPPRLVLNKVGMTKRPEISPEDFSSALELQPSAIIPYEPMIFGTAANNGQMIDEMEKSDRVSEQLHGLARVVAGRSEAPVVRKSMFAPLLEKFSRNKDAN